jgi:2-haloacid dehalogenase
MNRRALLRTLTGAVGAAALSGATAQSVEPHGPEGDIKAITFDGFVIFDPRAIDKRVVDEVADRGAELASLWRTRQFEYCWLRTSGNQYADFWQVTDDALRYAAKSLRISLSGAQHDSLLNIYRTLPPWPDVREGLARLRQLGIRMAFLSNFTAAMLDASLNAAGLSEFFGPHLSTDRVSAYKPSPLAYEMGPTEFRLQKRSIAFAASAAWDAAGAKWFGYPTVWVNRNGAPLEELNAQPDAIAKDMNGLIEFVARQ